ncbi:MAG: RHS repeat-associated core domain-containing protein, partial [Myxococcota bacterium]
VRYQRAPNVAGCEGSDVPLTRVDYRLTSDASLHPISEMVATAELSCAGLGDDTLVTRSFVDGMGQVRALLSEGEDEARPWVRSGLATFSARGTPRLVFQPDRVLDADADASDALALPDAIPTTTAVYDAFGRPLIAYAEDGSPSATRYHALARDACDALDLGLEAPFANTCTTTRSDGHGRPIDQVLRNRQPDLPDLEYYRLLTEYRADGAILRVTRAETASDAPLPGVDILPGKSVERRFFLDRAGRRLSATDPDTDSPEPGRNASNRSWRYLFNRVGDLVAVRDPRGCGQNFYYDHGGRLLGERYVRCSEAHDLPDPSAMVPAGSIALEETGPTFVNVRMYFDAYPDWAAGGLAPPAGAAGVFGHATASEDRGQRSVSAYNERGLPIWNARQMALPGDAPSMPATLTVAEPPTPAIAGGVVVYDPEAYATETSYDHAGRVRAIRYPSDPDWTLLGGAGPAPVVEGALRFGARGLPTGSEVRIDGAITPVVSAIDYTRDGLVARTVYGDDAGGSRSPTVTEVEYDVRRRVRRSRTTRDPGMAPMPSLAGVSVVSDQRFDWDAVSNLRAVWDLRMPEEWPDGHRPQSVQIGHDALYRVTGAEYTYHLPGGAEGIDTGLDWRAERERVLGDGETVRGADPMRSRPAPMVSAAPSTRVMSLTYAHDWLGNMTEWNDDAAAFHERSLGTLVNGEGRPAALRLATNLPGTAIADPAVVQGGWLEVDYGEGGNVTAVTVHGECRNAGANLCEDRPDLSIDARRTHLEGSCVCEREQHYQYLWDEVNRIREARRYDRAGSGDWTRAARQRYRYDATNQRTVKQTLSPGEAHPERVSLSVYPGNFERSGLVTNAIDERYEASVALGTETCYQVSGARVVWRSNVDDPVVLDRDHRITLPLADLIHSTTAVIDLRSGALVESGTYYPNGARESWRSNDDAAIAPERAGFTGKEADEEVGLTYFGHRYLMPHLGRWASPDPLQTHAMGGGEAMNSYHYVGGNYLQARDPLGLDPQDEAEARELADGLIDRAAESISREVATFYANALAANVEEDDEDGDFFDVARDHGVSLSGEKEFDLGPFEVKVIWDGVRLETQVKNGERTKTLKVGITARATPRPRPRPRPLPRPRPRPRACELER